MKQGVAIMGFFLSVNGCSTDPLEPHALLIANLNEGSVLRFDGLTGDRLNNAVSPGDVPDNAKPRGFRPSSAIAVDDRLLVANFDDGKILEFSSDGAFTGVFSSPADPTFHLEEPCALALERGNLFVLHNDTSNVAQVSNEGKLLGTIGGIGDMPPIRNPHGIAVRESLLYIATSPSQRDLGLVQVWDVERRERVDHFAAYGELEEGTGLAFSPAGTLLVADWFTDEVVEFDPHTGRRIGTLLNRQDGLNHPISLAYSPEGLLYVLHEDGVLRREPNGRVEPAWIHAAENGFAWARGISVVPE